MGKPRRHRETVARIADRALQAALERQSSVGGMRLGPARHGARHRQRAGQHPAIRYFAQAALREGLDRAAEDRATATVDVAHLAGRGVVDQPEGIAADAGHVWIEHRKCRARGQGGIDRRAAGPQHVDSGRAREGMRAGHHAVRRQSGRTAGAYVCHEKFLSRFECG